ncbi:AMP-dependent synthetase/ligase, partial [Streptomyces tubercidicus]
FAIWSAGAVTVPVYETSSAEQVEWILSDSGAVTAIVESEAHEKTVESVRERLPHLKFVWRIEGGAVETLTATGTDISEATVDERGAYAKADSPATIVYTSGTTGRPKGCVLSHRAFFAECGNVVERLKPLFRTGDSSVLLFLPLAHVFGRLVEVASVMAPIKLGHVSDIKNLTGELSSFRPTMLLGVPRVFEKVYNSARAQAQAGGKGKIFDKASDVAIEYSRALDSANGPSLGLRFKHKVFDRLVYSKLRAVLGGRAEYSISGGAPLGERLGHFYRGIGFTVLEGYGLTESCAATAFNPWDRTKIGTVGQPLPGSTVRIADDGEVLLHGEHLFSGYWNNEAATAEAVTDGWFHSGDIGSLDEDGYISITGRKKEIIVTTSGKNLSPAVLEERVREHPLIEHCLVIGNDRPYVTALVTLDGEAAARWLRLRGRPPAGLRELVRDPELETEVRRAVSAANTRVSKAESIRAFREGAAGVNEGAGGVTPTPK